LEYKWKLLVLTTIGVFMMSLDGSILNIAIYPLSVDLGVQPEISQWIPIIYLLVMAITLIGFGRLADLKGKKKFFLLGLIIFSVGSFLCTIAWSGEVLIVFRGIQAVGGSLISATAIAMVTETFPKQETGRALGINVAGIYLGLVLGPVLGGFLVSALSWRSIFYINIPIGAVLSVLTYYKIKESEIIVKKERFDSWGTITFGLFLASFLTALTLGNKQGWNSFLIITLFSVAVLGFIAFIFVEKTVEFPMLPLSLFRRNRVFAAANSAALLNYIATMAVSFWLAIYLQSIFHFDPFFTGLLLLPTPLMMAIMSPLSGKYSDKIGTRYLCAIGMGIMAVGVTILIVVLLYLQIEFVLLSQFVLGIGLGLFSSPNQSAIMKSVEKKQFGIASGTLSTMRVTGQSVSIALLSVVLLIFLPLSTLQLLLSPGSPPLPPDTPLSFRNGLVGAFFVTICICILGAFLSLVRGKEKIYETAV
jgi:EmrB/QacA subfamily drug resistance transporter